jgi:hypothetical protein
MKETRFANISDLQIISDFLEKNQHDIGKESLLSIDEKKIYLKKLLEFDTENKERFHYKLIIQVENSIINGLIYMQLYKFINSYFLYGLKLSAKKNYYKLKNTTIEELYNYAVNYAESIGYYSYYTIALESSAAKKSKMAFEQMEKLQRYEMYTLGYVDKEFLPYHSLFKIIKPKKTNKKILIRNFLLKNEFRESIDLSKNPKF